MTARWLIAALAVLLVATGCSPPDSVPAGTGQTTLDVVASSAPASFVNRVWVVAESDQVSEGELRVFLSDGTLVMASPHGTPAFGTWRYEDARLTITEEGISYPVDILELDDDTFRIAIRGPGEPIVIRLEPGA